MSREEIKPIGFEAPSAQQQNLDLCWLRLAVPASLLLLMAMFVLNAASLHILTTPAASSLSFEGPWPRIALADRWLLRPGEYRITATANGYQPTTTEYDVSRGAQSLAIELQPLPGIVRFDVEPEIGGLVRVEGRDYMDFDGDFELELPPGSHSVEIDGDLHSSWSGQVEVQGYGRTQQMAVELMPAWSELRVTSNPEGAEIRIDGVQAGTAPLNSRVEWGTRQISAHLADYYPLTREIEWSPSSEAEIQLQLVPREVPLSLQSDPPGATVTLNGQYLGQTPLDVELTPLVTHQLRVSRAGFRTLNTQLELPLGQPSSRSVELEPLLGRVIARVQPASAVVFVNGQRVGTGNQQLDLPATTQNVRVEAPGYQAEQQTIIPNPEIEQLLSFRLLTEEQARWANIPDKYRSAAGDEMLLFREPGAVQLGSDRSETERRANEVPWQASLQRSIYVSTNMVTNAQFRQFSPDHSSGNFSGQSLDGEQQPVVNLSWQQAALYCNWLSEKEGLEPFYQTTRGFVSGENPQSRGYRLMTEAEWVWLAATTESGLRRKYAWGDDETPRPIENYAAEETSQLINFYLEGIADDFVVSAPVGRFPANSRGLFDLSGNAAEWIHDWYDPVPYPDDEIQLDPLGPEIGEFHVIRGASWSRGYLPQLRFAYRDYGATARNDVGFRVVRYAD